jgi:hypothetical protein
MKQEVKIKVVSDALNQLRVMVQEILDIKLKPIEPDQKTLFEDMGTR